MFLVAKTSGPQRSDESGTAGGTPLPGRSRLGLVVTRKVGNAVARNRIKRVCRACFRLLPGFVPTGIDLVVVARAGAEALGLSAVQAEWAGIRPTLAKRCAQALAQAPPVPHLRGR